MMYGGYAGRTDRPCESPNQSTVALTMGKSGLEKAKSFWLTMEILDLAKFQQR
jgi:hypothetical protein